MGPLRAGAAAVAAVVVAGCAAAPAPPDRYYGQTLDWKACGDFQCATLTVPVDYAQPDGPTFALPVIKKPATGQRIGVLVAGAGGPGQSGVEMVRDSPESFPAEVREKFDVVSFDNRGVGGSEPRIECPVEGEPTEEAPDLELVGPDVPGSKQYAQACVKATGEHVLRNVGTANVIRDLDVLRAATGQDKLTYVGYSYGTRVGQLYAERYPDKVRAMVLDGVDNVFLDWRDDAVQQAEGAEQALHVYARECTTRVDACPGEDEAAILAAVNDALARADETGDGDALRSDIAGKLPFPAEWAAIADLVAPASDQPEEPEQPEEGAEAAEDDEGDALTVVSCMDRRHPTDLAAYEEMAEALRRASRLGSADGWLPCAFLPTSPVEPHVVRAEGAPPILLVGSTVDAATPYRWAQALATSMPSAVLLTNEDVGHAVYGGDVPCVNAAVTRYLVDLTPPAPRCPPV